MTTVTELDSTKKIYEKFLVKLGKLNINLENLTKIVIELIPIIQIEIGKGNGQLKKKIAIRTLYLIVQNSQNSEDTKEKMDDFIEKIVPNMIDILIQLSRNEIDLKKGTKSCLKLFFNNFNKFC